MKTNLVVAALAVALGAGCATTTDDDQNGGGGSGGIDGTGGTGGVGGSGGDGGGGGDGGTGGDGGGAGGSGGSGLIEDGGLIGDGETEVGFFVVADEEDQLDVPRDLGFHPERIGELWIVNRADDSTTIVFDALEEGANVEWRKDGFALHFMEEVSSIAFGAKNYRDDYSFGTCQESTNTYDNQADPNYFMGPALWTANLDIYAVNNPIGLGSHLDMLHESPLCMGIAHDVDNDYWVFDGHNSRIVRYDFQEDHDAGYDDHSDGIIHFVTSPRVTRVADVPSHLILDKETKVLYVADTGGQRIIALDTTSGSKLGDRRAIEPGTVVENWSGFDFWELVPASSGLLERPSGIALHGNTVYVSDNATGEILAFDREGNLLRRLATGVEAGGLMGIEVGPDQKLYFVDAVGNKAYRIEY